MCEPKDEKSVMKSPPPADDPTDEQPKRRHVPAPFDDEMPTGTFRIPRV